MDTSGYTIVTRKIAAGTMITLVPVGETGGWAFNHWDGTNGSEVINNTITMNGDKNITAVFTHLTCNVNITVVGQGTVSQELVVGALSLPNYKGDKVRLVPAPAPGWVKLTRHFTAPLILGRIVLLEITRIMQIPR